MISDVYVVVPGTRYRLAEASEGQEPTLIPATYVTVEIEGDHLASEVLLDGKPLRVPTNEAGTRGYLMLDLFRSVGFHQLQIDGATYFFGTDDAKLKLAGIQSMLQYVREEGLSWGSQLFFADGASIRHAAIDYAWLTTAAPEIVDLAEAISKQPLRRAEVVPFRGVPRPGRLFLHQTLRLLRRAPRVLLESSPHGPIQVGDERYSPRVAIIGRQALSFNTTANRRVVWLLKECISLAASLLDVLPDARRRTVAEIRTACEGALLRFPFAQLSMLPARLKPDPSIEELSDSRYKRIFDLYEQLLALGWEPGRRPAALFAYVKYADEIYQAFVALVVARAFGAARVVTALTPHLTDPVFVSATHAIYYDTVPPPASFPNWRAESVRPADMRPDLTIVNIAEKRGILLDAKYRVEPSGRLSANALEDAHVYMHSFGRRTFGICYPGPQLEPREITGAGNTIVEIPVSPRPGLQEFMSNTVRPRLEALTEALGTQ